MAVSAYCVIVLSIFGSQVAGHTINKARCPCSDPSLCKPIAHTPKHEIFTFTFKDERTYSKFNWTKVTTVISGINGQLTCYAHKHGARSVVLTDFALSKMKNATARKSWIQHWVQVIQENFMDGINIDVEENLPKNRKDLRDAYTLFVKEVTTAFKTINPNYQITVDVPYSNAHTGRHYDYLGLANNSDFLLIMDYDLDGGTYASSNSGYYKTRSGLNDFLKLGIPKEKIVMGFPWYGYRYPCSSIHLPGHICTINHKMRKNITQVPYSSIMETLKTSTTGRLWSDSTLSPYFNYVNKNITFQIQYDDPESLALKYTMAVTYQLRGVGMWTADLLNYTSNATEPMKQRTEMWQALPDYHDNQWRVQEGAFRGLEPLL